MATINIPPGFVRVAWLGPSLTLATATWKNNLDAIYRENTARTVIVLFKPGSSVNAVTTLEQGQFYLWKVKTAFQLDDTLVSLVVPTATSVPAPTINNFAPTSGAVGTNVTLTGTGFMDAYAVVFNNVVGIIVGTPTATSITATLPAIATTGTVKVYTAGGVATSGTSFTVQATAPISYTHSLTIPNSGEAQADAVGGITFAAEPGAKLEYDRRTVSTAYDPIKMLLLVGGNPVAIVDHPAGLYTTAADRFRYTAPNGTKYEATTNTFQDSPNGFTIS